MRFRPSFPQLGIPPTKFCTARFQHLGTIRSQSDMASRVTAQPPLRRNPPTPFPTPRRTGLKFHHKCIIAGIVVFVALCVLGFVYIRILPFSEQAILRELSEAADSQITATGYHRTHFPSPGCVLEHVEFHKGPNNFRLVSIDKLVIKGTYLGLLRHHVHHINAIGAQIYIPPFGTDLTFRTQHSNIVVEEIIANGAHVAFLREKVNEKPYVFDVHEALINNVRWDKPLQYRLKLFNPEPPGELAVEGNFGVWTQGRPQDTPISGTYTYDRVDLGVYEGIKGQLLSKGKFDGLLSHVNISGETDTPDFEVTSGGHKVDLRTEFNGYVNGMNGD